MSTPKKSILTFYSIRPVIVTNTNTKLLLMSLDDLNGKHF